MPHRSPTNASSCSSACDGELIGKLGREVMRRCDEAAAFSEDPSHITRTFCSPAMAGCHRAVQSWMESAGMRSRLDAAGNLIGRWGTVSEPLAAKLIVGSHLDTVPNGGRYDGMLGVLLGVALVEALATSQSDLPFAVEVVGFSEEEGVRYATPFIGSKAMAGQFDHALLERMDAQGVTLADALRTFGAAPEAIESAAIDNSRVVAYLETHIEQGPLLQHEELPLGVVTAIAGQTRAEVQFTGTAGHAGTVPMNLRRDAMAAAAEWILQVERVARETPSLVATVGVVQISPNVANVIPGHVRVQLDIRHGDDVLREAAIDEVRRLGGELSARRDVSFAWTTTHVQPAVEMDTTVTSMLAEGVTDAGSRLFKLVSGAGHDAAVMAHRFPAAMLFVRCRDGVSHHPDESATCEDVTHALTAMWHFVQRLAKREGNRTGTYPHRD